MWRSHHPESEFSALPMTSSGNLESLLNFSELQFLLCSAIVKINMCQAHRMLNKWYLQLGIEKSRKIHSKDIRHQ